MRDERAALWKFRRLMARHPITGKRLWRLKFDLWRFDRGR